MAWVAFRRVPFVPQQEMAECGAACLTMLLGYHGYHAPLSEVREACAVSRDGLSARDIVQGAKKYELATRAIQVEIDELDSVTLPAIMHWGFNHFVVAERLRRDGVDLVDPSVGRRRVTWEELDDTFTGVLIEVRPTEAFKPRRRVGRSLESYRALVRRVRGAVLVTIVSAVLLEVIGIVFPAATAFVVDFVVRPRQDQWLPILAAAFVAAVALRAGVSLARDLIVGGIETQMNVELGATLVKHVLSLPTSFFATRGVGELLSRVGALLAARDSFSRLFLAGFDALLVVGYAAVMLLFDLRLGAIVVGLYGMMALATLIGRERVQSATAKRLIASGKAQTALVQAFGDPEIPKAFRAQAILANRYASARARELTARADGERALEPSKIALALSETLSSALVVWLGGHAVLDDRMTLGVLSSFLAIQALIAPPMLRVVTVLRDVGDIGPLLDSIDDILDMPPEHTSTFVPKQIEGSLVFENVSFRYGPKAPLLLDNVSFRVEAGERVAIAGASGVGKSTILKLVLGFIQPVSGRILLDGRDLREYNLDALRSSIGTVLAGGAFFDETVFDNVTLGAPEATPEQVRSALDAACVADVVNGLPRGVLSRLGAGANRLSGGQRQRLLLTRALVKNPTMLLLDEASSALDAELERRVQAYLARMRCTMLVVAHRLSFVAFADRILFLSNGKIVQDGPFAVLIREPGPLRDFVQPPRGTAKRAGGIIDVQGNEDR
jgi:ABC-type bacteriocin/lantibiotic exporter with double-glycine peptidase domain